MDVITLFSAFVNNSIRYMLNPWMMDSLFLFIGLIVEIFLKFASKLLFRFDRLYNGSYRDTLFYTGLVSIIPAVIAIGFGIPFHKISRVQCFISCLGGSICGTLGILFILMKINSEESTGYYYRTIGFAVIMYNMLSSWYWRVAIQIPPYITGLLCYNVGTTIIVFHETKRKFE